MRLLLKLANVVVGVLALIVLLGGAFRPQATSARSEALPEVGHLAPDVALHDLTGRLSTLSEHWGKIVMLNFWATWCGPCRLEMPEIETLFEQEPADLVVAAVNMTDTERSPEYVAAFLKYFDYRFPVLFDLDGSAARAYRIFAIPTTFFVGPDGIIRAKHAGPMTLAAMQDGVEAARGPGSVTTTSRPLLPDGFQLGSLPISTANLLAIAGFILAYQLATRTARRRGLDTDGVADVLWWTAIGLFAGSRLMPALVRPAAYWRNPWLFLLSTGGPLALLGSVVGAAAGLSVALRRHAGQRLAILDHLMAPVCFGLAVAFLGWSDPRGPVLAVGSVLTAVLLVISRGWRVQAGEALLFTVLGLATAGVAADLVWPASPLSGGVGAAQWELAGVAVFAYLTLRLWPRLVNTRKGAE